MYLSKCSVSWLSGKLTGRIMARVGQLDEQIENKNLYLLFKSGTQLNEMGQKFNKKGR